MRNKLTLKLLKKSIVHARGHGLKILHFSFQSNHVHLILEAPTNAVLTRGMRSLTVTFAKGLKKGRIQVERYHLHVLRTIGETRNAIQYVLFNQQRHERGACSKVDEYTSLLSLKRGLELLRRYASRQKVWLQVEGISSWAPDPAQSFLARRGFNHLFSRD